MCDVPNDLHLLPELISGSLFIKQCWVFPTILLKFRKPCLFKSNWSPKLANLTVTIVHAEAVLVTVHYGANNRPVVCYYCNADDVAVRLLDAALVRPFRHSVTGVRYR